MSSLWTPGGEVPVDRRGEPDPQPAAPTGPPAGSEPTQEEIEAHMAEAVRQLTSVPAGEVVAQHAIGLYELAAVHLSQEHPRIDEARLAIDALAGVLEATADRLGDLGRELQSVLPQLRLAVVELAGTSGGDSRPAGAAPTADTDATE